MRFETRSIRWQAWLGLMLAVALLAAPVALATDEESRPQGAAPQSEKKKETGAPAGKQTDPKAQEPAADPKAGAGQAGGGQAEAPPADPGFNTIEEIVACRGGLAALWASRRAPDPEIDWR